MKVIPENPSLWLSDDYPPESADDFIGGARDIAKRLEKIVAMSIRGGYSPIKAFLSGEPGLGKTALLLYLRKLTGCSQWAIREFSGTDVTVDIVREVHGALHLCHNEMFGAYRIIAIQEADAIPTVAQIRLLDMLDKVPKRTIVFCTSNRSVKNLEVRFQSRFNFFEVQPPTHEQVIELLGKWEITGQLARSIAITANGSVRMALLEASEHLACCV